MNIKQIITDTMLVLMALALALLIFLMTVLSVQAQGRLHDIARATPQPTRIGAPTTAEGRAYQYRSQYTSRSTNYRANQYYRSYRGRR